MGTVLGFSPMDVLVSPQSRPWGELFTPSHVSRDPLHDNEGDVCGRKPLTKTVSVRRWPTDATSLLPSHILSVIQPPALHKFAPWTTKKGVVWLSGRHLHPLASVVNRRHAFTRVDSIGGGGGDAWPTFGLLSHSVHAGSESSVCSQTCPSVSLWDGDTPPRKPLTFYHSTNTSSLCTWCSVITLPGH